MSSSTHNHHRIQPVILVAILLLSFALRVARIEQQSIWYDEGLSIYYARGDVAEILRGVSESDHPPLHPLLLHLWMALCGDSELAVRFLSVWWGVLAVALLYRLGRRLSSATGGLAALLLTVSPLAVWYAQETRGYTMALALVTAAVDVGLGLLLRRPRGGAWEDPDRWPGYALYTLLAAGALYTHFFSGFVLLALNLAYPIVQLPELIRDPRARTRLLCWLGAQLVVLAMFAPWAPFVFAQWQANATHWHGAVGWRQIVRRTLTAFGAGQTLEGPWASGATWVLSILALLGTLTLIWQPRERRQALVLWCWLLVPTVAMILVNRSRPKFSPRYLMNALPPFLLLASAGVRWLFRMARPHVSAAQRWTATAGLLLATAILGGATTRSLANHYLDPRLYRPDFRAVSEYVASHATPNDLIVLVGGHSYPAFTYYYRGPLPVLALPARLLPTTQQPVDLSALKTLNQAIAGRQKLWLVLWQASLADPTGLIVDEIEQTYHRLGVGRTFHDVQLLLFDVSPGPLLPESTEPQFPMATELGGQIRLLGFDLPVETAAPGGTLYLYLYWQAMTQVRHDYKVFAQILDDAGQIVAQQDRIAGAATYPTSHWPPGAVVRDRFLLTIDAGAVPGRHPLIAGLYDPAPSLQRLPVEGQGAQGDHVLLTEVEVVGE